MFKRIVRAQGFSPLANQQVLLWQLRPDSFPMANAEPVPAHRMCPLNMLTTLLKPCMSPEITTVPVQRLRTEVSHA